MKNKKYHTEGAVPKSNRKIEETKSIPLKMTMKKSIPLKMTMKKSIPLNITMKK
jgi:hypothetical protein